MTMRVTRFFALILIAAQPIQAQRNDSAHLTVERIFGSRFLDENLPAERAATVP